jgi:predicted dehydrogenase
MASVGTSSITANFVAGSRLVPGAEFTVAYSRDPARARAFAEANGIAQTESDFGGLIASADVDALYIATPNSVHYEQCLAALEGGKHVLVEKPATVNSEQFAALLEVASANGVILLEAMRQVYDPGTTAIKRLLPEVGVVRRASLGYCQRSARYDLLLAGERVNIFDPKMGGGALLDLGVYPLATAVELFGPPRSVAGRLVALPNGSDGAGAALLEYDGFVVDISYSKISFSHRPSEIQGELGTITIDHIAEPRNLKVELLSGESFEHVIDLPKANLHHSLERFVALIGGEDGRADNERTLATLRLIDQIRG